MKKLIWALVFVFMSVGLSWATVSTISSRIQYNCDGIVVAYTYDFKIYEDDDIDVITSDSSLSETTLVLNTDYTVSGAGDTGGGTVTLITGATCASNYILTLLRNIDITQDTDFSDGSTLTAAGIEAPPDKSRIIDQQLKESISRSLKLPKSSTLSDVDVPVSASRSIGWNSAGTALTTYATSGIVANADFDTLDGNHGNNIATAIANIGAGSQALFCVAPTTMAESSIIPTNIEFIALKGCLITTTGYTLTINGPFNSGVHQVFTGSGTIVFGGGNVEYVYPEWWGTGVGTIQSAVAAIGATAIPIKVLPGSTYQFLTTLNIDQHYTTIVSDNKPTKIDVGSGNTIPPPILEYTGTSGTAILVSLSTNSGVGAGNFIRGVVLKGFALQVTQNTDVGLRVWHSNSGAYKNLQIFGNSDNDFGTGEDTLAIGSTGHNIGMAVQGGVDDLYEEIHINGIGIDNIAGATKYLGRGVYISGGYSGSPITTTSFNHVYSSYAKTPWYIAGVATLNNCVGENGQLQGIYATVDADVTFNDWWGENNTIQMNSQGGLGRLVFNRGRFQHGNNQTFFYAASSERIAFNQCYFNSGHANPIIFRSADFSTTVARFNQCQFSTNTTMLGVGVTAAMGKIILTDMQTVVYRFIKTSIATTATIDMEASVSDSGGNFDGTTYTMPMDGNIIGVNIYSVNTYTSGSFSTNVEINGSAVVAIGSTSAAEVIQGNSPLLDRFSAGDTLGIVFSTASYVPNGAGEDFIVEVVVAFGDDGL